MIQDKTNLNYIKKHVQDLIPGDIVLHPIYRSDGLLLINKNKNLNDSLINIIRKHVVATASILVSPSEDTFKEFSQSNNYVEFRKDLNQLIEEYKDSTNQQFDVNNINPVDNDSDLNVPIASELSSSPYWHSIENNLESEHLKNRASEVKSKLLAIFKDDPSFMKLFNKIKDYDDVLLIHSINTSCISLLIGITIEMSYDELLDLAVASLFSNIGYTELPKEEFKSFLKNHEYNHPAMRKNLEVFSRMTSDSPFLRKKSIIHGILDHNEFYNGEGFPNEKKGEEISLIGRILHIAYLYDSLVGGYNYTTGILPSEAFKIVYENKDSRFDNDILNIFMHRTTYFKIDQIIHLPNGSKGKIIGFDNYLKSPHLPIIQFDDGSIVNLLPTAL